MIIVTGTPGTGKTDLSKKISEGLGFRYLDVNELISDKNLSLGFDKIRDSMIVDEKKLSLEIGKIIASAKKGLVIDSHLSHYVSPEMVDLCIVTKCELKSLRSRLKKRGYSKAKVKENIDCEIFDVCLNEADEQGHDIMVIDTTELDLKKQEQFKSILKIIKSHFPGKSFK